MALIDKYSASSASQASSAYNMERNWWKAVSFNGTSPVPGVIAWSSANLVAAMGEDVIHIIDMAATSELTQNNKIVARVLLAQDEAVAAQEVAPTTIREASSLEDVFSLHRKRRFVDIAWSPLGCCPWGGPLLAVADSKGKVLIHTMPERHAFDLNAPLLLDLSTAGTRVTAKRLKLLQRESPSLVKERARLAFCPTPLCSNNGDVGALLCASQWEHISVWRIFHSMSASGDLLASFTLTCTSPEVPSLFFTAVAASPIWPIGGGHGSKGSTSAGSSIEQDVAQCWLSIFAGTSAGSVQTWTMTISSSEIEATPSDVFFKPNSEGASATAVTHLSISTDVSPQRGLKSNENRIAVVVAHGISVAVIAWGPSSARVFHSYEQAHFLPIAAICTDAAGALSSNFPSSSSNHASIDPDGFITHVRFLSLDVAGKLAQWRCVEPAGTDIGESPPEVRADTDRICCASSANASGYCLELCGFLSTAPKIDHFLTPIEKLAVHMGSRVIRAGGGENSDSMANSLMYSSMALSPSGCLLVVQACGRTERTTHQKAATHLFVTHSVKAEQIISSLLWTLCAALSARTLHDPFCTGCTMRLSLWDIAEATWAARTTCSLGQDETQQDISIQTSKALITWLQGLIETKPSADSNVQSSRPQFLAAERAGFFCTWLEVELGGSSTGGLSAVERCQLRHALIELNARLTEAKITEGAKPGKQRTRKGAVQQAHTESNTWHIDMLCEYWCARLGESTSALSALLQGEASPLLDTAGTIRNHVAACHENADGGEALRCIVGRCRVCQSIAEVDPTLENLKCKKGHILPLCQWTLTPLLTEPSLRCNFCRRSTIRHDCVTVPGLVDVSNHTYVSRPPESVCAWCAAFVG